MRIGKGWGRDYTSYSSYILFCDRRGHGRIIYIPVNKMYTYDGLPVPLTMAAAPVTRRSRKRRKARSKKGTNRGGYDCELVAPLLEAIQAECPICLSILKEPCLISCPCGQKICRECVEWIKNDKKPCPLCNKTDFTFLRDHGLERQLKTRDVFCSKKKLGCQWKGKLGDFEQHLNENPSPEEQLTGCGFVEVECKHGCGEWYERHFIHAHQNEICPQRTYSCEYCKEYDSTFEDVTEIHYAECGKYPVACPNKCQEDPFERSKIKNHLNDKCPLTEVCCPFAYAGCEVKLPRKDMPGHTADISVHFPLLASYTREIEQKLIATEKRFEEKQRAIERQFDEKLKAAEKQYQEKQRATERNSTLLEEKLAMLEDTHQIKSALGKFPIDFQVTFEEEDIFLPPFFTHPYGYKMCIHVYPKGVDDGEGTHVSVFTCLMQGPFDDQLKWPFRGEVTIQIVNQAGDHSHAEDTIPYNDKTKDSSADRVTGNEVRSSGWGYDIFIAHTDLAYNAAMKTQYLKDNTITVRVVQVTIIQ